MVKSRPSRDRSHRFDPIKAEQSEQLKDDLPSSVIFTQLRNSDPHIRELACIAVANFNHFEDPESVVKLVIERITDAEPAVQTAALHAAITLASEHSQVLLGLGAVTLVLPILASHVGNENLYSGKQEQLFYQSLVSTSFYFLSALAAQDDGILKNLKSSNVVDQSIQAILTGSKSVALAAVDLLQLFVEDDKNFSSRLLALHSQDFLNRLPALDSECKTGLVGLVFSALEETSNFNEIFKYCLPVILELLNLDIHSEFLENVSNKLDENDFKAQEHFWTTEARAQQNALEMLTNLLTSEEGEEPQVIQRLNVEHVKFIAKAANGVGKDIVLKIFNYPDLMIVMLNLQNAAFACIQNLILNTSALEGFLAEVWTMLLEHFDRSLEFSDEETEFQQDFFELLTILSKNLCAICKKYPENVRNFQGIQTTKLISQVLTGISRDLEEMTENLLGILSCFVKDETNLEVVEMVLAALVKCCQDVRLEVNTEALNVFFDAFNDERFDFVLQKTAVMPMMAAGVEEFKVKIRNCKDADVREHAQEALENLVEFIKYKAQHISW
jgi:hypothetical protein